MKVFITGISGFIGSQIARKYIADNIEVHGIIRSSSDIWRLKDIKKSIHIYKCDIRNKKRLTSIISKIKPDIIFHLAVYGAYPSQNDAETIFNTSLLSTLTLLRAAKDANVKMIINTGSSSEYGTKFKPMKESDMLEPNSYYAIGKASQTFLCHYFCKKNNMNCITIRPFSVYGPFEESTRLIPTVISKAQRGEEIQMADRRTSRDFIYIDDVVNAYVKASTRSDLSGNIYNIGTGNMHDLESLLKYVLKETKSKSNVVWGKYKDREFDTKVWVADIKKSRELKLDKPTSLIDGLKKTIEWTGKYKNEKNN